MNSTPDPKSTKDVLVARADEQLSHVREQIARADEQLARVTEQLEKMEREGTSDPSPEPAPPSASTPPPEPAPAPQPSSGRPARSGLIGIYPLLAVCIVGIAVAALVSQSSRGGVKLAVSRWAPQLVSTSSLPPEKPPLAAQPDPPPVQVAAAKGVTAQAAPLAQTAPQEAAPAAAPTVAPAAAAAAPAAAGTDSELAQSLQTMAHDLTKLEQSITELKAKQDQMASDYAKAIEQLKAKQDDMTRRLANISAQNAAPRASPPPARPVLPRRARERPLPPPVYWDDYEPW
jgi:uncharacterized coiled-coil protein SlyX